MNWKSGFQNAILNRGEGCFRDGAVVGLHRDAAQWQAMVVGTELYRVGVALSRGRAMEMRCSCPYAEQGRRCKHMAALFYALERLGGDAMNDDDAKLSRRLDALSSDETEDLLQLAIDAGSTRCTALLLNHRADGGVFSPDEFTLDDLPEDALSGGPRDVQGDNDPMKLLFPEQEISR